MHSRIDRKQRPRYNEEKRRDDLPVRATIHQLSSLGRRMTRPATAAASQPQGPPAAQPDGGGAQPSWSIDNLTGMQAADNDLAPILEWLKSGKTKPAVQELKPYSPASKVYCAQWNNLKLDNGVVYHQYFGEDGKVEQLQAATDGPTENVVYFTAGKSRKRCWPLGCLKDPVSRTETGILVRLEERRGFFLCRACITCNLYHRGTPQAWTGGGAEIARVDNAGVDESARRSRGGHLESGQRSTKKQGWTTLEWPSMSSEGV